MQRAQSDDEFRHANLRSNPLILNPADRCRCRVFMHQRGSPLHRLRSSADGPSLANENDERSHPGRPGSASTAGPVPQVLQVSQYGVEPPLSDQLGRGLVAIVCNRLVPEPVDCSIEIPGDRDGGDDNLHHVP